MPTFREILLRDPEPFALGQCKWIDRWRLGQGHKKPTLEIKVHLQRQARRLFLHVDLRIVLRTQRPHTVLRQRWQEALARLDLSGVSLPQVREGTVGAQARSLGAAAIPLSQRYLIDQNAAARGA